MNLKLIGIFVMTLLVSGILAQEPERSAIPDMYKWNLSGIYSSNEEWQKDKAQIVENIEAITKYSGILTKDAETLYQGLKLYFEASKAFSKLHSYASFLKDQDTRSSENQSLYQQSENLGNLFSEKTAFLLPELSQIKEDTLQKYLQEKPELEDFRMLLENILRKRAHTLSDAEEKILALTDLTTRGAFDIYKTFTNAEFPWTEVELSNGQRIQLTVPNYAKHRQSSVRADREKVFQTFFEGYARFKNTCTASLAAELRNQFFVVKARKYNSCLEAKLYSENIPTEVYANLIKQIHASLPVLHRFLKLKKKALGLEELHYYDLYVPITPSLNLEYKLEDAQKIITKSLEPVGVECQKMLENAFNKNWIDFVPNKGKRNGAYCNGSIYDLHPFILMNWTDDYNSLSTLTHELGHAFHSHLANKAQPYAKSDYAIFIAEIASTFNEAMLNEYLIKNARSDEEKLFLLGSYLEGLRTTIFRQTLFAEFELLVHQKIENGEPITGESASKLYLDLVRKYYGHDEGICIVDPYIAYEWIYVHHFYYNFYVYQYATSLIYATAIAQKVFDQEEGSISKYLSLLKGGGSDYPVQLLQKTGLLDPLSMDAFNLTMKRMNQVMDEIEKNFQKK